MSASYAVQPKQTVSMWTRDRVRLDADVYTPVAPGETFPVLLMRQPYGRAIASTVVYAHPRWYAAQGYIVVIQDVRGRGTSEGDFDLFASEIEDGGEAVTWAAQLPQSNGLVGMYGFSYQGMTQLFAAMARPAALRALAPSMVGYDLYADWAYEGDAFCLQGNLGWAVQIAAETARLRQDTAAYDALCGAARQLPLANPTPAQPQVLTDWAPDSFYHDWVRQPVDAAYWRSRSPDLTTIDVPMLHIGGWYDAYLRGTLRLYQELAQRSQYPQPLVIGPWSHLPWSRRVGAIDFGPQADTAIDALQIRWFDWILKGRAVGWADQPAVQLFDLGRQTWRLLERWPEQPGAPFYLTSTGLAGLRDRDGQLQPTPPTAASTDIWVHDPWRPVPALGGHAAGPAGMWERSAIDGRSDVLTYTTAWLVDPLVMAGAVTVELYATTDAPSFDLCAVLSVVHPDGRVYNLSQGYRHVPTIATRQPAAPITIALQPVCVEIPVGQALRLSLSAACFPAYPVNPGTGVSPLQARLIDRQIITIAIASSPTQPSCIRWHQLPAVEDSSSP